MEHAPAALLTVSTVWTQHTVRHVHQVKSLTKANATTSAHKAHIKRDQHVLTVQASVRNVAVSTTVHNANHLMCCTKDNVAYNALRLIIWRLTRMDRGVWSVVILVPLVRVRGSATVVAMIMRLMVRKISVWISVRTGSMPRTPRSMGTCVRLVSKGVSSVSTAHIALIVTINIHYSKATASKTVRSVHFAITPQWPADLAVPTALPVALSTPVFSVKTKQSFSTVSASISVPLAVIRPPLIHMSTELQPSYVSLAKPLVKIVMVQVYLIVNPVCLRIICTKRCAWAPALLGTTPRP